MSFVHHIELQNFLNAPRISGAYGSSVGSLFNFVRWIFFLNVILFIVWLPFVLLPQAVSLDYATVNASFSITDLIDSTVSTPIHIHYVYSEEGGGGKILQRVGQNLVRDEALKICLQQTDRPQKAINWAISCPQGVQQQIYRQQNQ